LPPGAAREVSDRFMRLTSEGKNSQSRGFYGPTPPDYYVRQFDLFRTRPIFPLLAAFLYPRLGPHALQAISAAAYVCAVALMFGLLLLVAPAWLAALGALGFATAAPVLDLASYPLTDELALALWIGTLYTMILALRRPSIALFALLALAALALTFTRPAAYLPVGAAMGALVAARSDVTARRVALGLVAVTVASGLAFLAYTLAVKGPGIAEQLRWEYDFAQATGDTVRHGFVAWYLLALARALGEALTLDVYKNGALFTIALAAFGLVIAPQRRLVPVLLGASCASLIALLVNPLEFVRTVELPLTPIVVLLATATLAVVANNVRSDRDLAMETS
ncbi:MAG TPA: hypothetical protein VE591_06690, partial [Candidatus Acidoferrum sp.]|nr:hypothetical protein [Candidatus Acidoferrum sp.]